MKSSYLLALFLFTLLTHRVFAFSQESNICIKNTSLYGHQIFVSDIKNYDWDGDSRPDKNFNNLYILPGMTICQREEVNSRSRKPTFTFLIDGAPTEMAFLGTVPQGGDVWKGYYWFARDNKHNPLRLHGHKSNWSQPEDFKQGYACTSGYWCALFEIR